MISTATRIAAGISVISASRRSSRGARRGRTAPSAAPAPSRPETVAAMPRSAPISGQAARVFLQERPGLRPVLSAPLGVEAGLLQYRAEGLGVRLVEGHAFL